MSPPACLSSGSGPGLLGSGLGLALLAGLATSPAHAVRVATRAVLAAGTTTTPGGAVTATGSEYGWASFLVFLVVIDGGFWL